MIYIVENSGTRSEIAGVGLVVHENKKTFKWLNESFKNSHFENLNKVSCIMADKDLFERNVLKDIFENIPI